MDRMRKPGKSGFRHKAFRRAPFSLAGVFGSSTPLSSSPGVAVPQEQSDAASRTSSELPEGVYGHAVPSGHPDTNASPDAEEPGVSSARNQLSLHTPRNRKWKRVISAVFQQGSVIQLKHVCLNSRWVTSIPIFSAQEKVKLSKSARDKMRQRRLDQEEFTEQAELQGVENVHRGLRQTVSESSIDELDRLRGQRSCPLCHCCCVILWAGVTVFRRGWVKMQCIACVFCLTSLKWVGFVG